MITGCMATHIFFSFHPETWGRWTHFDEHIFQMGWFNHQPGNYWGWKKKPGKFLEVPCVCWDLNFACLEFVLDFSLNFVIFHCLFEFTYVCLAGHFVQFTWISLVGCFWSKKQIMTWWNMDFNTPSARNSPWFQGGKSRLVQYDFNLPTSFACTWRIIPVSK